MAVSGQEWIIANLYSSNSSCVTKLNWLTAVQHNRGEQYHKKKVYTVLLLSHPFHQHSVVRPTSGPGTVWPRLEGHKR